MFFIHNTLTPNAGVFHPMHFSNSLWTLARCPTIYSILTLTTWSCYRPHKLRAQNYPSLEIAVTSSVSPCCLDLCSPWLKIGDFHDSLPQIWKLAIVAHWTQGQTYLLLLVYYITKYTDEQSEREMHRVRSRKVLGSGASLSIELGMHYTPGTWMCSPTW